jgi:hypothetical protein
MPDQTLRPADPDDLLQSLSFALRYDGRRRSRHADTLAADIVAKHLLDHLMRSGYVVMQRPPAPAHSIPPGPRYRTD